MMHTVSENKRRALCWRPAVDLTAMLDKKETTAEAILDACLSRIAEREPLVQAWAWHDADAVRRQLRLLPQRTPAMPLHGLPIGIKDIIDTNDMPTAYGSRLYQGHRPSADATVVKRLRAAGAIIAGKAVTTEFAYQHPGPTVNPHDVRHTPGGSSSGSAAAVADGMVPIALGSQTGGSTIRPSAYCGVVGFKPTFGMVPMDGIRPLAPSLDTIGIHARSVADVALVYPVLLGCASAPAATPPVSTLRVAYYPGPDADRADADARRALEAAREVLSGSGMAVAAIRLPDADFGCLSEANRVIMAYEAAPTWAADRRRGADLLGQSTLELIEAGAQIERDEYERARALSRRCLRLYADAMREFDVLMTFSAPGAAPLTTEGTGSSLFNCAWTTLGVPCLTLPFGTGGSARLPLGVQLVGAFGQDTGLLQAGMHIETALTSLEAGRAGR